jgi:phage terminase large subunit
MQPSQPVVELQVEPDCVPDWFWPLLENNDRYLLLWGGRDSAKSDGIALKLLLACINLPYFKCVMARKQLNKVFGSIQATLEKVAKREGIDHLFRFGISPQGVWCKENGNSFLPFGMDEVGNIKSLSDPTHVWYEEANQIEAQHQLA